MVSIQARQITKHFGDVEVVRALDLDVEDGEFLVLLGPSGCGKTTLLRILAGLEEQTSGSIQFDGVSVDSSSPRDRDVAFVFQSYALYPGMTVRENLAFPLVMARFHWWHHVPLVSKFARRRAMREPAIREQVERVAEQLGLEHLLHRRPRALSGGQRQRVALGRAMVRHPKVFLMDEPLSNLDAVLRTSARALIAKLHRNLGSTIIYVTHDQTEAMTLGTRVLVLSHGVCQQLGRPNELYDNPANLFVARFVGAPPMNILPGEAAGGTVDVGGRSYVMSGVEGREGAGSAYQGKVFVGIRPEHVRLVPAAEGDAGLEAEILTIEESGMDTLISVQSDWLDAVGLSDETFFARLPGVRRYRPGDRIRFEIDSPGVRIFDADGASLDTTIGVGHDQDLVPQR